MNRTPSHQWRLKDLRRLAGRGKLFIELNSLEIHSLLWAMDREMKYPWGILNLKEIEERWNLFQSHLDRIISKYGPNGIVYLSLGGDTKFFKEKEKEKKEDNSPSLQPKQKHSRSCGCNGCKLANNLPPLHREGENTSQEREEAQRTNHKIGSQEVSLGPHTNPNADVHGGDGNSGEMDHRALTKTENREGGNGLENHQGSDQPGNPSGIANSQNPLPPTDSLNPAARSDSSEADESRSDDAPTREDGDRPNSKGEMGGENPTREMGTPGFARRDGEDKNRNGQPAPSKITDSDDRSGNLSDSDQGVLDPWQETEDSGDGGTPTAPNPQFGGNNLDNRRIKIRQSDIIRLTAALRRLVDMNCSPRGEATPRYEAKGLIREIVSKRMALHKARKREAQIKDLVIAVDQSGSCSATVNACYATALAVARKLPKEKISIILHSNGLMCTQGEICAPWLIKVLKNNSKGLANHYYSKSQASASERVWEAVAERRPGLVLFLGDYDSDWAHELIASKKVKTILMTYLSVISTNKYSVIPNTFDAASAASEIWKYLIIRGKK